MPSFRETEDNEDAGENEEINDANFTEAQTQGFLFYLTYLDIFNVTVKTR
jgi:hypothetical protein